MSIVFSKKTHYFTFLFIKIPYFKPPLGNPLPRSPNRSVLFKQIGDPWNVTGHLDYSQGSCLGLGLSSVYNAIFHGFVDEVRISRGVLTVKEFMREGRGGTMIVVR